MKSRICFFLFLVLSLLSGCSLIGAEIGKEVDRSIQSDTDDPHKYETQYFVEGLDTDIEIVKAIFTQPEKEQPYVVPDPCKDENTYQVCSVKKGCWCENDNN